MKPCKHRHNETDDTCGCTSPKLVHGGTVRLSTCEACPYDEAPAMRGAGDLLHRGLSAVGITQKLVERVTRTDCGCSNRIDKLNALIPFGVPDEPAEPEQSDAMQFVWVYWHAGAAQDELRWSIRSVEQNYQGTAKITIVGDRPAWYTGHYIRQPRQKSKTAGFERGLRDVLSKMETISRHPDIQAEFIWMMDDVFMVRPTSREEMKAPRAGVDIEQTKRRRNRWRVIKGNTARRLARNGFPVRDYGTHLPHFVEKQKLRDLFATWKPLEHVFLWEVAYSNTHKDHPRSHVPFLRRIGRVTSPDQYDTWAASANFFNIMKRGWNQQLRAWMASKFPNQSSVETGDRHTVRAGTGTPEPIDGHIVVIQSAYTDAAVSAARLEITKATCIPSLTGQTNRPQVVVSLCRADPYLIERQEAFRGIGDNVRFVFRHDSVGVNNLHNTDPWGLPVGPRNLVGRLDDDDVLSRDYCEITKRFAANCVDGACVQWPNGYVWHGGEMHRMTIQSNQFVSIVSRNAQDPHEYDHRTYGDARGVVTANDSRGWIWVRHEATISHQHAGKTMPRYLKATAGAVNWGRWSIDLDGIAAAAQTAQQMAQEYRDANAQILGHFNATTIEGDAVGAAGELPRA